MCNSIFCQPHVRKYSYLCWSMPILVASQRTNFTKTCPCNVYPTFIYSKTRVCSSIPIFLIFAPKHRFWEPQRGSSNMHPQFMFGAKIRKISTFLWKIFISFNFKNSLYIAWACFCNEFRKKVQTVETGCLETAHIFFTSLLLHWLCLIKHSL